MASSACVTGLQQVLCSSWQPLSLHNSLGAVCVLPSAWQRGAHRAVCLIGGAVWAAPEP